MYNIMHDSYASFYREPFGATMCGTQVRLRLKIGCCKRDEVEAVLCIYINNKLECFKMQEESRDEDTLIHTILYKVPADPCVLWYYFEIKFNSQIVYYGNNWEKLGGEGAVTEKDKPCYQITVHKKIEIPHWYKQAIMYQIFVDRFYNGNEDKKVLSPKKRSLIHSDWYDTPYYIKDQLGNVVRWDHFGGNLKGIEKKLEYLASLGVGVVYLNPIFEATSNHRYDTGDYKKIDSMFGDLQDFQSLIKKGKSYGIRFILDGVFSHTGSDSIYFNKEGSYPETGAYQSRNSPYYSWYRFSNYPEEYESWWGVGTLPNVNEMEPSYQSFICGENGVIQYWIEQGAAGWRLDVADELPDSFIKKIKTIMKKTNKEAVLIGEVWEDASNKVSYDTLRQYLWGEELDSIMNYPFRAIVIDFALGNISGKKAMRKLMSLYENYPREIFYSNINLLGTHDVERILTVLGEGENKGKLSAEEQEKYKLPIKNKQLAIRRLKLLSLIQMTFPGVPCIYYGDEAGVQGFSDPYNRGTYPWGKEEHKLLNWYKKIVAIRKKNSVFVDGEWRMFSCSEAVLGFIRTMDQQKAVCVFNRDSDQSYDISLEEVTTENDEIKNLIDETIIDEKKILIKPLQGSIFLISKK